MPIDNDLPAEDQDGQSQPPTDADGNVATDDGPGSIDVPVQGAPDDDDDSVQMQEDGSAIIALGEEGVDRTPTEFFDNLADGVIPLDVLKGRAIKFIEDVDRDRNARRERDEQQAEGIKRTGLGGEAPGGADFEGASRAVHPVLAEGCVDFAAKAMKEIFPPTGPCRTKIIGKSTPEKTDKAERKRQYMNWQLTEQIPEYRTQTKKLLTQLPLGGSQYKHWWYDKELGRAAVEFVPIDNVILPAGAEDFYSAQRITLQQDITEQTYLRRVDSGYYRDSDNDISSIMPEQTKSAEATAKVDGVTQDPYNADGLRRVLIINSAFEAFDDDDITMGDPAPYIWHIDETTREVLAVYRNWDPDDDRRERLHWLVDWTFIHWRGPQGVGLLHLIGSLSGAITGGIRSVLDSVLAQNSMSGMKLKGGKVSGTNEQPAVGEVVELEGPTGGSVDDIRKIFMPYPFNQTSPVIFPFVQWLVDQARGVVQVASEKLAEGKTDMPVGSTLALIEEGSNVFSDIHAGLHASQAVELKILHRLNKWHLQDKETVEDLGDLIVQRDDFSGPCDIIPVSDPRIFSETQRFAQIQAVHQLMLNPLFAEKAKADGILKRTCELLHLQDADSLFKFTPEPEDLDPVSENMVVGLGEQPVKAFNFQDHMAHLKVHLHFMTSPMFGANPMVGPKIVPALMQHCQEHLIYAYVNHSVAAAAVGETMQLHANTPDDRFAVTMTFVDRMLSEDFLELGRMFQMAIQLAQQYAPKPPPDPASQAQIQIGMAEIQRKTAADKQNSELRQHEIASNHVTKMAQINSAQQLSQAQEQQRQQLDSMVQSQKDQRERDAQANADQRDKERLQSEENRAAMKMENDRVIQQIKEQHETHRAHIQHFHDALNTAATAHQQSAEASQKMAAGGPLKIEQDPAHAQALGKLADVLGQMHQAQQTPPEPQDDPTAQMLPQLVQMLQQGQQQNMEMITQGLVQVGQQMAHAVQQSAQTMSGVVQALAGEIEGLHDNVEELHSAHAGVTDRVEKGLNDLHKAVNAPRIRTLKKGRKGEKMAVDRPAKEGEVEE